MKILKVGDLHLYTKEIRSSKKMVENNEVMLKGIYDFLVEDEEIEMLMLMGDIQHKTPSGKNTIEETALWKHWFRKIGKLMLERYDPNKVRVIDREEGQNLGEDIYNAEIYPVFTLMGNHDIDNEIKYTFYDDLVAEGLVVNPKKVVVEDAVQINFHNYGEAGDMYEKEEGIEKVIGLYHDVVATVEMPFWLGDNSEYPAEKVLDGVDLAVIGDIHTNYDPIYVNTESGGRSVAWILGSMGRTSFSEGQIRDFGYCGLVDTDDLEELGTVEIELIKKEDYFDYKKELKTRMKKKDYKDFSLDIGEEHIRQHQDPREDIRMIEGLDEGVRVVCLGILDEVLEG